MLLSELSWIIYNVGRLTYCFRQVVTVGWANGSIVNPSYHCPQLSILGVWSKTALAVLKRNS